jgi:hypothetical protein
MKLVGVFKIHPHTKFYETFLLNRNMEYIFHAAHTLLLCIQNKSNFNKTCP